MPLFVGVGIGIGNVDVGNIGIGGGGTRPMGWQCTQAGDSPGVFRALTVARRQRLISILGGEGGGASWLATALSGCLGSWQGQACCGVVEAASSHNPHVNVVGAVVAAVDVLRCWQGNGRAAVAGRDASEAAPCPLQPCYFDKWDLFADTWDCQYAMGFPVCIFKYLGVSLHNFIPIFPIS